MNSYGLSGITDYAFRSRKPEPGEKPSEDEHRTMNKLMCGGHQTTATHKLRKHLETNGSLSLWKGKK